MNDKMVPSKAVIERLKFIPIETASVSIYPGVTSLMFAVFVM